MLKPLTCMSREGIFVFSPLKKQYKCIFSLLPDANGKIRVPTKPNCLSPDSEILSFQIIPKNPIGLFMKAVQHKGTYNGASLVWKISSITHILDC
ncbi:hypothetical protein HanXRQr2_Chr11g0476481 [Helianthus annuus]|uniref:Uncharacterized protein n=1 Tax=Helianthus annuus TaxID=4232 RepID=A0A251RT44_HELAN|nr:hypothetical protein HanXRQr2_Chr11g0476481 [Helianthus annuus]